MAALELPADERETVDGALRQVDFLDSGVGLIERELAGQALSSEEIRRLMTVPGVSLISAATFVAVVASINELILLRMDFFPYVVHVGKPLSKAVFPDVRLKIEHVSSGSRSS
jgi:hypothetical protein